MGALRILTDSRSTIVLGWHVGWTGYIAAGYIAAGACLLVLDWKQRVWWEIILGTIAAV